MHVNIFLVRIAVVRGTAELSSVPSATHIQHRGLNLQYCTSHDCEATKISTYSIVYVRIPWFCHAALRKLTCLTEW